MHPWQQQMELLRARTAKPGLVDPARARTLSGLAFLQAIVDGTIPDPPITHTLDFYLLEVEQGRAVFQGLPAFAHYNPIATVHGGYHATLLDSAMACAVQTLCEVGRAYTTLEFKIHCVRALTEATGPVRAEGKVVAGGRRMATSEGRLVDSEGRLYSHGTTTCMLFDLQS
ncbi:MAG TPA: PaaI family thioesterase [Burkholderiaceae bacterium]|nr:PaaI family thioesterase [Burkholderiaceae bacterium]